MEKRYKLLVAVLLIIIIALLILLLKQCGKPAEVGPGLYEDPNAVDIREQDAQKGGTGNIAVPGFEKMTVKVGATTQDIWIYNPKKNNCLFVASIILPDGKTVYKSGYIAPGKAIYKAKFTQQIRAGIYENTVLQYDFYTLEGTAAGGTKAYFTLEVEQ